MLNLTATPYTLDAQAEEEIAEAIRTLDDRVNTLRHAGTLTEETLKKYYGDKRFEQVAESNAIEGSTLSVGETELAVSKGVTITGHDPAYIRDAVALDAALTRLAEMAENKEKATDLDQLRELHELILGDRPSAGSFRNEPVRIKGAQHVPPKTREQVMDNMEAWQGWSRVNTQAPAVLRAIILHAWLTHIHPFVDGNGRTSRAISNLELVRAGYPPMIIRKKDRERYLDALGESDEGGDIRSLVEFMLERVEAALIGLELSAKQKQDFNPALEKIRMRQESNLAIWETSVALLVRTLKQYLTEALDEVGGSVYIKEFESPIDIDDYRMLMQKESASRTWCFIVNIDIPDCTKLERLAWIGFRGPDLYHAMDNEGGPAICWSKRNPEKNAYIKWVEDAEAASGFTDMASRAGVGDAWFARMPNRQVEKMTTTELARKLADNFISAAAGTS